MTTDDLIAKYRGEISQARRYFHMHPEKCYEETMTQGYIIDFLRRLGIEYRDDIYKTAVVALVRGRKEGKTIAVRADMDALSMKDETDVDYRSQNDGMAHACGHDSHMAIMLYVAAALNEIKADLRGNAKIIFQPAEEEGVQGGAKGLVENGVLKNPDVDVILSTHVWPDMPLGKFGVASGRMMASCDLLRIKIFGKAGHISMPQKAKNAVVAASQFINTVSVLKTHYIDPFETVIWDLPSFQSVTTAGNVISQEVRLAGSVRAYSDEVRDYIEGKCGDILEGFKKIYEIDYEYKYLRGYSPLINDPEAAAFLKKSAQETIGRENVTTPVPSMGSEDFSGYLKHVKGAFSFLGTKVDGEDNYPLHHCKYITPDEAIEVGARIFIDATRRYLCDDESE
jgi:amidohydrolase